MGEPAQTTPPSKPQIDVCSACGKLFPRVYVRLCPSCFAVDELRFQLVRDFLYDHDGATVSEISEATGLSRGDIGRFHSEGRLVVSPNGTFSTNDESCTCRPGGNRCPHCRRELANQFQDLHREMGGMHGPQLGPPQVSRMDAVRYVRRARRQDDDDE